MEGNGRVRAVHISHCTVVVVYGPVVCQPQVRVYVHPHTDTQRVLGVLTCSLTSSQYVVDSSLTKCFLVSSWFL